MARTYAVILAAGLGTRFGDRSPKQLVKIEGRSVLEHSINAFEPLTCIDEIILVINVQIQQAVRDILSRSGFQKPIRVVLGGQTRLESTRQAVRKIQDSDRVLVHDAVRPFLSRLLIERCLRALEEYDAVYPVVPATSTIVRSSDGLFVSDVPERSELMIGQTPQGFKGWVLRHAHEKASEEPAEALSTITNDCALVHRYNICPIRLIEGERQNVKITYPEDEKLVVQYLEMRAELDKQHTSEMGKSSIAHLQGRDLDN